MSKQDDELQEILMRFASNFAQYHNEGEDKDDPYWWGHDTNLGSQSTAFSAAKRSIRAFKVRHMKSNKPPETYKELGRLNRDAIAKAVWGRNVPGWWKGSTAEFGLLTAVSRAKV